MPATDYQSLLANPNVPCYLNMAPGVQTAIELALLQDWLDGTSGPIPPGPPDQVDLIEWLQADKIKQADGTSVATWPHTLGSDGTSTGAQEPTLKLNIQNGLPVVRFNGTTNKMSTSSIGTDIPIITLALAFKYQGSTVVTSDIASVGTSDLIGTQTGSFTNQGSPVFGLANNNFNILFAIYNVALSTIEWAFNGAGLTTTTSATNGPWTGALNISSVTSPSQVDIGEVIVWSADETANYAAIYAYMHNRWA